MALSAPVALYVSCAPPFEIHIKKKLYESVFGASLMLFSGSSPDAFLEALDFHNSFNHQSAPTAATGS